MKIDAVCLCMFDACVSRPLNKEQKNKNQLKSKASELIFNKDILILKTQAAKDRRLFLVTVIKVLKISESTLFLIISYFYFEGNNDKTILNIFPMLLSSRGRRYE